MYEDIINSHNDDGGEYYHSSYLKPVYKCEDCNMVLTTVDGEKEFEPCSICGKLMKREMVSLEFYQSNYNATMVSC